MSTRHRTASAGKHRAGKHRAGKYRAGKHSRPAPALRAALAVAGAVVLATAAGACATLPTSGGIKLGTLQGAGGPAQLGVQVLPVPPGPDWTATQIVRGFLAASASFTNHHAVARQYLTKAYAKVWRPGWAATIVSAPAISKMPTPDHIITAGGAIGAQVKLSSRYNATMSTAKQYEAGNVVVSAGKQTYEFALTQNGGAWRIADINKANTPTPRSLLLLTQSDFERDYQPRNLYYFPAGSTANSLIPEPVYIPEQAAGKARVRGMVKSLLRPPPETSWLFGAAKTAFPANTKLLGVQVISGLTAVVDVGGAASRASSMQRSRMAAQLYWSLTSSPYIPAAGTQIRSVVLEVNHRVSRRLPPRVDAAWVPRGSPAQGYLQAPVLGAEPVVKVLTKSGITTATIPGTVNSGQFRAIAVTPGKPDEAVLAGCSGKTVYLVPQWRGGAVVTQTLSAPCTSLSWDDNQNLWLTAGRWAYLLPGAGRGSPVKPEIVPVDCPSCTGAITSLRVAPDGVRVAMIVKSGSNSQVMMAAISSSPSFTYLGQAGSLVRVGSDIGDPVALTWLDPDHLLVLGQSGTRTQLYEVPLNGGSSTEVAAPQGVMSISASWPSADALPRVIIGIGRTATSPGKVLISNPGLLNRGWSLVAKGITPVFPG